MEEKILALHPQGLNGVNISHSKYDQIREAILQSLSAGSPKSFQELTQDVDQQLSGKFDGSISWYCTTVKLDLEARGEIECYREPGKTQVIQLPTQ